MASNSGNENNDGNESCEEEKSKYKNRHDKIPFEGDIIETYWKTQREPILARVLRSYYGGLVRVKFLDEKGGIDSINLFSDTSLTKFDIIQSVYFGEKVDFRPIPRIDDIIKIEWQGNLGSDTCKVVGFEAKADTGCKDATECKANEKKRIHHFNVECLFLFSVLSAVYCAKDIFSDIIY